jgi:hypothetical protein
MGALTFPHPPLAAGRLASRLLLRHSPHEIAEAIEVLVDILDLLGGDPDAETEDPDLEPAGDEKDAAWAEWHTLRSSQKRGPHILAGQNEDDELGGDETDGNGAEDEEVAWFRTVHSGPGCTVSDSDTGDDGL